jgi:hypothetical protein
MLSAYGRQLGDLRFNMVLSRARLLALSVSLSASLALSASLLVLLALSPSHSQSLSPLLSLELSVVPAL